MVVETEKAYAAGLIDGEGCINVSTNMCNFKKGLCRVPQHIARVSVEMTDREPLEMLSNAWGGSVKKRSRQQKSFLAHWKNRYYWVLTAKKAREFLIDIEPYLINKREQAQLCLEMSPNIKGVKVTEEQQTNRENIKLKLMSLKEGELSWQ